MSRVKQPAKAGMESVNAIFDVGAGIPPRPEIVAQIQAEIGRAEPDSTRIERLISADVGISAALIKTINSPFYGLRVKASSVRLAISMLGMSQVGRVVTGISLQKAFPGAVLPGMENFWEHSAELALVCSYIAKQMPGVNADEAFTFGLFKNCGIPLMAGRFPAYRQTWEQMSRNPEIRSTDIETRAHNISHAQVGSLLAKTWGLPESIVLAIRYHHDCDLLGNRSDQAAAHAQNLIALALLAEYAIESHTGFYQTYDWIVWGDAAKDHFGITDLEFEGVIHDVLDVLADAHTE